MYVISRYMQTVASKKRKRHLQARELKRLRARVKESRQELRALERRSRRLETPLAAAREGREEPLVADSAAASGSSPPRPLSWSGEGEDPDPARSRGSSTRRARRSSARCPRSASRACRASGSAASSSSRRRRRTGSAELCEKLLANPLIEDYEIELDDGDGGPGLKFGVLQFPGSCDERDALLACRRVGDARLVWHADADLGDVDVVVVPGGFSYGDYLRAGAIARFAPAMEAVARHAEAGGAVLGICNGFQVLCEAGLLPGALLPNDSLRFVSPAGGRGGRERRDAVHPRHPRRASASRSPSSTSPGATSRPPEQLEELEAAGRGRAPLRAGPQPQRLRARDRRGRQRARERDGA